MFRARFWGLAAIFCLESAVAHEHNNSVSLTQQEYTSLQTQADDHVLSNPWWRNFDIHGFGAAGFYDTGSEGTLPHGGFSIKEASLFVHADVWENVEMVIEVQTNRLGKDDQLFVRTGEVLVNLRDVYVSDRANIGLKLGRIDIPFGEEYLWQDAIDNPLITNSASYVYGWDEGVMAYGNIGAISFVAAITDGTDERSSEDHDDKAVNVKISGRPTDNIYLGFSAMRNGKASKSAVEFGGSHFEPIGQSHSSSVGTSPSNEVNGTLFQLDAKISAEHQRSYIAGYIGTAMQDDDESDFERDFSWFGLEALHYLSNEWYLVGRYSEIGTYESDEGYHFDGKIYAGGNARFGYDTERFRRMAIGLGYEPNPRMRLKIEIGQDQFDLIDASTLDDGDNTEFFGIELAVKI